MESLSAGKAHIEVSSTDRKFVLSFESKRIFAFRPGPEVVVSEGALGELRDA